MNRETIKITINGSNMNLKLKNCSAISEVAAAYTLIKHTVERLNTTEDEIFGLAKDALEAEKEKNKEKAFAVITRIKELVCKAIE